MKMARLLILPLILLPLLILPAGNVQAREELEVPEGTVYSIDGLIYPQDEWDAALGVEGISPWLRMCFMCDERNLYILFEGIGSIDEAYLTFDANQSGEFFDKWDRIIRCFEDRCEYWLYTDLLVFERLEEQECVGAKTYHEEANISRYEVSVPLTLTGLDVWSTPIYPGLVADDAEYPFTALIGSILVPAPLPPLP